MACTATLIIDKHDDASDIKLTKHIPAILRVYDIPGMPYPVDFPPHEQIASHIAPHLYHEISDLIGGIVNTVTSMGILDWVWLQLQLCIIVAYFRCRAIILPSINAFWKEMEQDLRTSHSVQSESFNYQSPRMGYLTIEAARHTDHSYHGRKNLADHISFSRVLRDMLWSPKDEPQNKFSIFNHQLLIMLCVDSLPFETYLVDVGAFLQSTTEYLTICPDPSQYSSRPPIYYNPPESYQAVSDMSDIPQPTPTGSMTRGRHTYRGPRTQRPPPTSQPGYPPEFYDVVSDTSDRPQPTPTGSYNAT